MEDIRQLLNKSKSFILINKITFIFVSLFIISLLFIIYLLSLNFKQKAQINSYIKSLNLCNQLETQIPTQVPTEVSRSKELFEAEPLIVDNKLISPFINRNYIPKRIHWTLLDGWEFENYSFTWCKIEGGVCEYQLTIKSTDNPEYKLEFKAQDSGVARCNFSKDYESENIMDQTVGFVIPEYRTIKTDFGYIRLGKSINDNKYTLCQNNITSMSDKTSDWLVLTEIGWIEFVTPDSPDEGIIDQMIQLIQLVNEEIYTLK